MRKGKKVFYWTVALVLAFCIMAPGSALAQTAGLRIFVNLGDIKGESTDKDHKDWCDAFSYGDGISQGVNPAYRSYGAMTPDFAPITIIKQIDAASPKLREASAKGTHLSEVTIEMYEGQFRFFVVKLKEVVVSSVQAVMPDLTSMPVLTAASSPSVMVLQEKVSFVFGAIEWTYTKQRPDGTSGGNVSAKWSLVRGAAN
ncbi:MAG TPA: type VI secretion system tube protein Hcp [Syntrophales bacterium]|nr:type VI secretion system tube protein Hcp [Syntrophales bacterium]